MHLAAVLMLAKFVERLCKEREVKNLVSWITAALILSSLNIIPCTAGDLTHVYSTWDFLEVDTCASAWLIQHAVDPKAEFRFYPKGELILEGTPFDTPDAELRRKSNMSTFESILQHYEITDPALNEIGRIIHDVEVNYWSQKARQDSTTVGADIREIINSSENPDICIERCFDYFDQLLKIEMTGDSQREKR